MKRIKVEVKTGKRYVFRDYSALHDSNLRRVKGHCIFGDIGENSPYIRIIEEGLKIPFMNIVDKKGYLDTCIEYKGKRYFTKRKFIKKESFTETKELKIPNLDLLMKNCEERCLLVGTCCEFYYGV